MKPDDENYFFKLSNWNDELAKLEGRIADCVPQESSSDLGSDDHDASERFASEGRRKKSQTPSCREALRSGHLSSLYERRDFLLDEYENAYFKFAEERFESLEDLREQSPLGELYAQCAFAVTATLESFFAQFEKLIDHHNSTVETLLTLSEELDFADQSCGDQEPLAGLGAVRLADEEGGPRGIRVGEDEAEFIDGICARTDFTNNLASIARQATERILAHETRRVVEHAPFSINGDHEHVYGVPSQLPVSDPEAPSTFGPSFGIQETVHYPMVPGDWTTEKRAKPKKRDSAFWRVVHMDNYLKHLKNEARVITDHFDSLGRSYPDIYPQVTSSDEAPGEAAVVDPAHKELTSLQLQIRELRRELEPAFLELAKAELRPIVASASEPSQSAVRDSCRAAVEAIISRYSEQWGSMLSLNNNATHLLIHFSAHLRREDASTATPVILRDETQIRSCGIRIDDKEFRFVGVKEGMDSFKQTVLSAVDEWVRKRQLKREELLRSVVDNHCSHFQLG